MESSALKHLVSGSSDQTFKLWNLATNTCSLTFPVTTILFTGVNYFLPINYFFLPRRVKSGIINFDLKLSGK